METISLVELYYHDCIYSDHKRQLPAITGYLSYSREREGEEQVVLLDIKGSVYKYNNWLFMTRMREITKY